MKSPQTNIIAHISKMVDSNLANSDRGAAYRRWVPLVWLNAGIGIYFSLGSASDAMGIGIVLGVMTYVVIYAELDRWLAEQSAFRLRKRLYQAALIRFLLQGTVMLDFWVGAFGLDVAESLFTEQSLGYGYTATVVHAAILSVIVGLLMAIVELAVRALGRLQRKLRRRKSQEHRNTERPLAVRASATK